MSSKDRLHCGGVQGAYQPIPRTCLRCFRQKEKYVRNSAFSLFLFLFFFFFFYWRKIRQSKSYEYLKNLSWFHEKNILPLAIYECCKVRKRAGVYYIGKEWEWVFPYCRDVESPTISVSSLTLIKMKLGTFFAFCL